MESDIFKPVLGKGINLKKMMYTFNKVCQHKNRNMLEKIIICWSILWINCLLVGIRTNDLENTNNASKYRQLKVVSIFL